MSVIKYVWFYKHRYKETMCHVWKLYAGPRLWGSISLIPPALPSLIIQTQTLAVLKRKKQDRRWIAPVLIWKQGFLIHSLLAYYLQVSYTYHHQEHTSQPFLNTTCCSRQLNQVRLNLLQLLKKKLNTNICKTVFLYCLHPACPLRKHP